MLSVASQLQASLVTRVPSVLVRSNAGWTPLERHMTVQDADEAKDRYARFAPILSRLFADSGWDGVIGSRLIEYEGMSPVRGRLLVKCDHDLPLTGTVKARGGVYEVLCLVERLGCESGLIERGGNLEPLLGQKARRMLAGYRVLAGSTGNLGYSIGLVATAFGLKAEIHMSHDAKGWKKERLRKLGVHVVEHSGDFGAAVQAARQAASADGRAYFIDDEASPHLMAGYSAGAWELAHQLESLGILVDREHPLFVYLPCGVGGTGGGITFGLKKIFGPNVKCIFAEPVASACMYLALSEMGVDPVPSVHEAGLDNRTIADGLAVGRASELIVAEVGGCIDGVVALHDNDLLKWVCSAWHGQGLRLEPAAAAGFAALSPFDEARSAQAGPSNPIEAAENRTHVVWTTGGSQLPEAEFAKLIG